MNKLEEEIARESEQLARFAKVWDQVFEKLYGDDHLSELADDWRAERAEWERAERDLP